MNYSVKNRTGTDLLANWICQNAILAFAIYFASHALLRAYLGAPPELDEAEQFAISTHYAVGYGPHPPLYQWLQVSVFNLFGVNYFSIAVLKNTILFGTYCLLYLLGLHITQNRLIAAIGSFGLLLSANFAWESQHDQSHTVSNTFLTVAVIYVAFLAFRHRKTWHYILLGVLIGLWSMAKYNFVFPLAALTISCIANAFGRQFLADRRIFMTLILAAVIATPHYHYILSNFEEATVKVVKLGMEAEAGALQKRLEGLGAFFKAFLGVHGIWILILVLGWLRLNQSGNALKLNQNARDLNQNQTSKTSTQTSDNRFNQHERMLVWFVIVAYLLMFLFVLVAGTTRYRDHWLQPAAVFAPLFLAVWFKRFATLELVRPVLLLVAFLMPVILFAYILNNQGIGTERRDANLPSSVALSQAVPGVERQPETLVFSHSTPRYRWLSAGHIRSHFSKVRAVFDPNKPLNFEEDFWLIWSSSTGKIDDARLVYGQLAAVSDEAFSPPVLLPFHRPFEVEAETPDVWWLAKYNADKP